MAWGRRQLGGVEAAGCGNDVWWSALLSFTGGGLVVVDGPFRSGGLPAALMLMELGMLVDVVDVEVGWFVQCVR